MKQPNGPIVKRVSLQQLMNKLLVNAINEAEHHQSCVVNEISKEIMIDGNNQKLISVISELLDKVVVNSHCGEIHISADRFSDVVILSIQERNNYNGYALSYSVSSMENAAISLGGHISIKGPQQKVATVSFSFPAQVVAA